MDNLVNLHFPISFISAYGKLSRVRTNGSALEKRLSVKARVGSSPTFSASLRRKIYDRNKE